MKVSVIIPVFNHVDFLMSAVNSVLAQSYPDWELIIIDDGSTDGSVESVADVNDSRIRVIRQSNAGVAMARNRGLSEAKHEWVALLDADDTWKPNHLSDLLELQAKFPEAILLGTGFWYVNKRGQRIRPSARATESSKSPLGGELIDYFEAVSKRGMPFVTSSVMLNRAKTLMVGGFVRGVTAGEDLLLWARLASQGPVAWMSACSTNYLEPPMVASGRSRVIRRPQTPDVVGAALMELQEQQPVSPGIRGFRATWYRMRAVLWLELNERRLCIAELRCAIACDGLQWRDIWCALALLFPLRVRSHFLALKRRVM